MHNAVEKVRKLDRKNRTIFVGACAPVPLNKIIFLLNQKFPDLLNGLAQKNCLFIPILNPEADVSYY